MKKFKTTFITPIAVVFILFIGTALKPDAGYKIGDTAADFKLKNVTGKNVTLADYKTAKGFIVVFTCNHCPFAKAYEQRIMDLNTKYATKGFPVIAINPNDKDIVPDDSFEEMKKLAEEKKYAFPYLYDETQNIAHAFGATRTPHVFILSKEDSKLVVKYIGAIDDNADDAKAATKHYVESAVDELLAGQPVKETSTKAIGCSIKWKK